MLKEFLITYEGVLIHTSARDATALLLTYSVHIPNFNPRIREGCDLVFLISVSPLSNFNPRIREGCDRRKQGELLKQIKF